MKKANANFSFDIFCTCPHCKAQNNHWDNERIRESLGPDNRVKGCDVEVVCPECMKKYIVENVEF